MQMNRVVIADCVSRSRKCSIPLLALPWPMSGRARASDTRMAAGKHGNSRTGTASVFTEKLADVAQVLKKGATYTSLATAVHRARQQQTADGDRGEPVSRDRARPKQEQ